MYFAFFVSSISAAILFLLTASVRADDVPWKIDETTAQILAVDAVYGSTKYINSFAYEGSDSKIDPPFFVYDGMGPVNGSFGFFAVNPWTGDVWNLWGCWKESKPASRKLQVKIRKKFTADELKQYTHLSRLKPGCTFELSTKVAPRAAR